MPTAVDALLFMSGSVLSLAAVWAAAFGGVNARFTRSPRQAALWGSFHSLSVGGAIGAAASLTCVLTGPAGWPLAPFASTVAYLLVLGVRFSAADERGPDG